jgi:hypothetical protein
MIWEKMSRGLKSLLDFDDFRLSPCLLDPLLVLLDDVSPRVGAGLTLRSTLLRRPAMVICCSFGLLFCVLVVSDCSSFEGSRGRSGESCRVWCASFLSSYSVLVSSKQTCPVLFVT